MATTYQLLNVTSEEKNKKSKTCKKKNETTNGLCNNYPEGGRGGDWEMGEICPKTKSYPPLIKQKLISTPAPHIMIILRLTPPSSAVGKRYPPIDSLIPSLLFGFLPPVQTSLQMTLRRMSKSHLKRHQNH